MKKIIFNIMLFVLCFAGALGCVVYSGYANKKEQDALNQNNKAIQASENNFLVSMINNITTAESISGDLRLTSASGKTDIKGKLELVNDGGLNIKATLNGEFEKTKLQLVAYYIGDTLYLSYEGLNLSFKVEDAMSALSGIFDGATTGDLSGILNMDTLSSALTDMKTEELDTGGKKITISVPYIGDLHIITNSKDVPLYIGASGVELNNDVYNLSIILNNASSPFNFDKTIYTEVDINGYSEIISSIVNIISNGGATFTGKVRVPDIGTPIDVEFTINDKLEMLLTASLDGIDLSIIYKEDRVYIDILNNLLSMPTDDLLKFIDKHFNSKLTLTLIDTNTLKLNTGFGSFKIALNINESSLDAIYINSGQITANLKRAKTIKTISLNTSSATTISYENLNSLYDKCMAIVNAKTYDVDLSGNINNINFSGQMYINPNEGKTGITDFAFRGSLNSKAIGLTYTGGEYFLSYDGLQVKFSAEYLNDLYNYFSSDLNIDYIDFDDVISFIKEISAKISIKSSTSLSVTYRSTAFSATLKDYFTELKLTNMTIGGNTINANAKIYNNTTNYSVFITNLNKNSYTDLSNTSSAIKSVANSVKKSSAGYTGKLTIGVSGIRVYNVDISLKTSYSNGKLKLVANLTNLPTTLAVTNYNSLLYKNHKATITIYDGEIKVHRTIEKRFSGATVTEVDKTYNAKNIDINILQDVLGLSNFVMKQIKNSSASTDNSFKASSLVEGLEIADSSIGCLTDSLGAFGISKFNAKLAFESGYIKKLNLDVAIKNIFFIGLTLESK